MVFGKIVAICPDFKCLGFWIDLLQRALLQDGILNPFPTDVRPSHQCTQPAIMQIVERCRKSLNAKVPLTIYFDSYAEVGPRVKSH